MATCNCQEKDCTCDNNAHLNEHLSKILSKSLYNLNEASFKLIDNLEEDDMIPDEVYNEPKPETGNSSTAFEGEEDSEEPAPDEVGMEADPAPEAPLEPTPEPEKSPDQVQNEILKLNISAMEKMQKTIDQLDLTVDTLNQKMNQLGDDVEEVREPTNVEKLMNRKDDSHPYHYTLDDMWNERSFQGRMDQVNAGEEVEKGIMKMDDGSYVADFDELPKHTDDEIKKSLKNF